jgi:hypothetical protein
MDHFYHNIHGFFDFEQLYSKMIDEHSDGAHFVEIGAFYGKSSAYMAVSLINSGKKIHFDVIDTWRGSPEHQEDGWDRQESMVNDTAFDIFQNNMLPVKGHYNPIKKGSIEAAALYADRSLDFVFIDADHSYEAIKADVEAWLPKVKLNGYIGGHDYTEIWNAPSPNGIKQYVDSKFENSFVRIGNSWLHKVI